MKPDRHWRRRPLVGIAVFVLASAFASCAGSREPKPPSAVTSFEKPATRVLQAAMEVTASGAVTMAYDTDVELTVSRFDPPQLDLRVLTVGLGDFVAVEGGKQRLRTAFDLVGAYNGPGTYEIAATGQGSSLSNTFLQVVDVRDAAGSVAGDNVVGARRFDRPMAPCTIEVGADERSGTIHCRRLADDTGAEVDYEMRWSA